MTTDRHRHRHRHVRPETSVAECEDCATYPSPLEGSIPFGDPGEPLLLWNDTVHARPLDGSPVSIPAVITLAWPRTAQLAWKVDESSVSPAVWNAWSRAYRETKTLLIDYGNGIAELDAGLGNERGGPLNGGDIGSASVELTRVLTHWIGLPNLLFGSYLHEHDRDGAWRSWQGRSTVDLHGWSLTIDARSNLSEVLKNAKDVHACVITHVMELRRSDGAGFTPAEASDLLWGLQFAISFANGYWIYPAAPTGFDRLERIVWREWRPGFADPARHGLGWWNEHRPDDLWSAVDGSAALICDI